ncbi:hypothetical protein EON82_11550 [bacterium]|nr:MAG: hypothetical protein EON82_11550 [bacterium]
MSTRQQESFAKLLAEPEEVTATVQQAVRQALIEHHKAGQKVPTWRDGKVVWVAVTENGEYAD